MEGNPLPAVEAAQRAKRLLDDAMMTLLARGDIPAAYEALRDAQAHVTVFESELEDLARVNGTGSGLDALEDRGEDPEPAGRPPIVCLCGSTRFYDTFQQTYYDLTMQGEIVLSVGFYPHAKAEHGHGEGVGHDSAEKVALDELHKRKIDLADYVLVLNVGGYIGESTRSEIEYAERTGRRVRYLESDQGEADPGYIGKGHTESSIPRALGDIANARCPDKVPCRNQCGEGPCFRTLGGRHLTDPRALNHGGRTIAEQEDISNGLRCPACLSPYTSARGGVPSGGTAVQCTHIWHTPLPPPDPDRKSARTLLANVSLTEWIPAGDLAVELISPPALAPGRMHTGEQDRGVRVTHEPTGTIAEASSGRSQLQNKSIAISRLRQHPNVMRYLVNQRCTHGADCTVHPDDGGMHNYDHSEETP